MRLKKGGDNFSVDNLRKYYIKNKVLIDKNKSLKVRNDLKKAHSYAKNRKYFKMLLIKLGIFFKYRVYRKHFMNKVIDGIRFNLF